MISGLGQSALALVRAALERRAGAGVLVKELQRETGCSYGEVRRAAEALEARRMIYRSKAKTKKRGGPPVVWHWGARPAE